MNNGKINKIEIVDQGKTFLTLTNDNFEYDNYRYLLLSDNNQTKLNNYFSTMISSCHWSFD